ncbi:MAG TPA: ABC transporter permease [Pseudoxanthomonas sp.]|nr:ABC transporter permease [Pseudoxanthomonas sp.]
MNAVATHKTNTFQWLLKREFWENRGGFVWAPAITGIIAAFFAAMAGLITTLVRSKHDIHVDDLAEASRVAGQVGDGALLLGIGLAMAVVTFVVFFYSLGSLYDDRRDRSILFWKSLPVSDTQMVLSKLAWALLLAPLLALAVGVLTGVAFWLIAALTSAINGVPGASGILTHSHPLRIIGNVLLSFPVQILWSLPTVGWLMLCSAWAKRFPFLWSVLIPFLFCAMAGVVALMFKIASDIELPYGSLLYVVLYRGLLSIVPGTWMPLIDNAGPMHEPADLASKLSLGTSWQALGHADIWIGIVAGVAMIYLAIRMRRWRELAD